MVGSVLRSPQSAVSTVPSVQMLSEITQMSNFITAHTMMVNVGKGLTITRVSMSYSTRVWTTDASMIAKTDVNKCDNARLALTAPVN